MTRPVIEISDETMIERMTAFDGISVHRLAQRLHISDERIRAKLLRMIADGKVRRERESKNRNSPFRYYVVGADRTIANGEFEIPTHPVLICLTGSLVGYDAEFARRRELCMTTRRAA